MDEPTCAELMAALRAGDAGARARVFEAYYQQVIGEACRLLRWRVKEAVEPANVAASVLSSFFSNHTEDAIDLHAPDGVWGLLLEMTLRHCEKWNKRFRARKRRPAGGVTPIGDGSEEGGVVPADDAPGPEEAVDEADYYAHLVRELEALLSERQRTVLALHLSGRRADEIADRIGFARPTVDRELAAIRAHARTVRARAGG